MPRLLNRWMDALDRRLDAAIPSVVRRGDALTQQRARAVLLLAVLITPLGVAFGIAYHGLLGAHAVGLVSDALTLAFLGSGLLVRLGRVRSAVAVLSVATWLTTLLAIALTGGHSSVFVPFLVVGLLFAAVLQDGAGTVGWALAYTVSLGAVLVVEGLGVTLPTLLPPEGRDVVLALAIPGSLVTVVAVTWLDRSLQRRARRQAEALAAEREEARRQASARAAEAHRALEAVQEAREAQRLFFASMNHELRNPLSAVSGTLELLALRRDLSDEARAYVERALRGGEALLEVVEDTLDWARLEAGHLEVRREPVDLAAACHEAVDLLADRAAARGLALSVEVADAAPGPVADLDARRVRQVLLNLVGNAIAYTAQGGILVRLVVEAERVVIEVADTGPGIPGHAVEALFDPFVRADRAARRPRGTGLGLAISQRLVGAMGGTIEVDSTLGEGTTFRVAWPHVVEPPPVDPPSTGDEARP